MAFYQKKLDSHITKRLEDLIVQGEKVLKTKQGFDNTDNFVVIAPDYVDTQLSEEWGVSALSFIGRV